MAPTRFFYSASGRYKLAFYYYVHSTLSCLLAFTRNRWLHQKQKKITKLIAEVKKQHQPLTFLRLLEQRQQRQQQQQQQRRLRDKLLHLGVLLVLVLLLLHVGRVTHLVGDGQGGVELEGGRVQAVEGRGLGRGGRVLSETERRRLVTSYYCSTT